MYCVAETMNSAFTGMEFRLSCQHSNETSCECCLHDHLFSLIRFSDLSDESLQQLLNEYHTKERKCTDDYDFYSRKGILGMTFLHCSILKDRVLLVAFLVNLPIDVNSKMEYEGIEFTPLHLAVYLQHAKCVHLLLCCKYVDLRIPDSKTGRTPLHTASSLGDIELVRMILNRSDSASEEVDIRDRQGRTPLMYACTLNQNAKVWIYLMEKSIASAINSVDNEQKGVLHIACCQDCFLFIKVFTLYVPNSQCQSLLSEKDSSGRTVIHYAVEKNLGRILCHLVLHCNVPLNVQDSNGDTALHLLIKKYINCKKYIADYEEIGGEYQTVHCWEYQTVHCSEKMEEMKSLLDIIAILLKKGANTLILNNQGKRPHDLLQTAGLNQKRLEQEAPDLKDYLDAQSQKNPLHRPKSANSIVISDHSRQREEEINLHLYSKQDGILKTRKSSNSIILNVIKRTSSSLKLLQSSHFDSKERNLNKKSIP